MLVEDVVQPGLVLLRSPALSQLGVPHAFSTRCRAGLRDEHALARAGGLPTQRVLSVHQVHGAAIHRPAPPGEESTERVRADGLVGDRPGDVLRVVSADCVPVLIATADGREVAAVHAGWRGLLVGVIPAALLELAGDAERAGLVAAVGPCLSPGRFEVGPELAAAFEAAGYGASVASGRGDRSHVDLRAVAARQLRAGGVTQLDVSEA
ncbi:MAG: hypothetical protein DRQ55_13315, partial [Planctomycetota bacterium]